MSHSTRPHRLLDTVAFGGITAAAAAFVWGVLWRRAEQGVGVPSYDVYGAHYPNMIYALRQLQQGHGLLWNSLQNCGQPFLPSTLLGLFYPLQAIFLVVDPSAAYWIAAMVHLTLGGIGTYLLCRALHCGPSSAATGALAFIVSASTVHLAVWMPTNVLAVYVWIPWAMLLCERILQRPSLRRGLLLGVVLSVQLLPGYPQISFFTYQLLGLRLAWECVTRGTARAREWIPVMTLGVGFPLLLGGIQLYPMAEFAAASIRNAHLTWEELNPWPVSWAAFRHQVGTRVMGGGSGTVVALIPTALAVLALLRRRQRGVALFYLLCGTLYFALAFRNPLLRVYRQLPFGSVFRFPSRFLWVTGFALSALSSFAAEAVVRPAPRPLSSRAGLVAAPLVGGGAFYALSPVGLTHQEWLLLAFVVAGCALVALRGRRAWWAGLVVPIALLVNLTTLNSVPFLRLTTNGRALYGAEEAFSYVRQRVGWQDRIYQFGPRHQLNADYAIVPKSASVFDVASIDDYEPQTSARYAALFVRLLYDAPMRTINEHIFRSRQIPASRPLVNLVATRFFVVPTGESLDLESAMQPGLRLVWENERTRVYENAAALPRALYVPRLEVIDDPAALLERLASPGHDPHGTALVESVPSDGFLGDDSSATGVVDIVDDHSEELVLGVRATAAGFVSLQDQYYPGWEARVNDSPATILRGNYAFRVIRVPAGESRVVLRYRPWSVWLGAGATLLGCTVLVGAWIGGRTHCRGGTPSRLSDVAAHSDPTLS